MKKIITAMGSEVLNNELKKYAKYDVLLEDLFCQELVMDNLNKFEIDVLIISGLLQGQWNLEEFIEKIRNKNAFVRIIIVTDEIDNTTKKILEAQNVFDIFIDSTVEIENIIDAIDREEAVKKKYEMISENNIEYKIDESLNRESISKEKNNNENIYIEKTIQKQEIIAISGISGAGKSTIAANLCRILSQKSDAKILLMDLDTLNGNIDEILKIDKVPQNIEVIIDDDKKSGINYASELIIKNRFDSNVFDEIVVNADGFDVLTGNISLHYCQNVLKEEYYDKILQAAKEKYDFIIIDTSSNIFLDSTKWALHMANRILFISENNYLSIKKMQQFINVIVNIWGIWKHKIEIIVNKKSKNELELETMSRIMENVKIVGEIKLNEENNYSSYEKILSNINYIPKKNIIEKLTNIKNIFNKVDKEVIVHAN